jgi:3-hydroxyisobutyrate dehydrogenase-like beta-hydroxyacid dehydrogenase
MQSIGFVGLGAIGTPMAQNLVKAGFEVRGYDVRAEAVSALAAAGARPHRRRRLPRAPTSSS